jgi:hypothetical protein
MAKTKNSKQSSDVDIDAILESTSTAKESNGGSQCEYQHSILIYHTNIFLSI